MTTPRKTVSDTEIVPFDETLWRFVGRQNGEPADALEIDLVQDMVWAAEAGKIDIHGAIIGSSRLIPARHRRDFQVKLSSIYGGRMWTVPSGGKGRPGGYLDLKISRGDLRKLKKVWERRI